MSVSRFATLARMAEAGLAEPVARYIRQGSGDETSAAEAVAAWQAIRLRPHALCDVSGVALSTTLLGTAVRAPIAVAPSTFQRALDPRGEVAMAEGVAAAGSLLTVSSNAGSPFEAIGATGVAWWLQAYVSQRREAMQPLLERAVAAGTRAIVLTADTPVVATKNDHGAPTVWQIAKPGWLQVNFEAGYGQRPGDEKATDLSLDDIGWLTRITGLPVVIKGILRGDDATRCIDAGASAVWVSNHGGRQLDGAVATADCLAEVVDAAGGAAEVYVDGGIRSGRHVLSALALGARAAFIGRPPLWALAAGGAARVTAELEAMGRETREAMQLAGMVCPGIDRSLIAPR